MIKTKENALLYQILSGSFCVLVILSNIISAKMVKIPCFEGLSVPAGALTYPLTFLLSALAIEFFGEKNAKQIVYLALGMNILTFGILKLALIAPTLSLDTQSSFSAVVSTSGLRIFSSLAACLIAQMVDIQLYAKIKRWTGLRFLWLRLTGSSWISQLVDTILLDFLFLYWGMQMEMIHVLPIMFFSFAYKMAFCLFTMPIFYLCVFLLRRKQVNAPVQEEEKTI